MPASLSTTSSRNTGNKERSDWKLTAYPVMEHFYTIQGEGAHAGQAAYFIRLAGCDVGCWWCDVQESWDASVHPEIAAEELVDAACESGSSIVVITGGEPLMHDLTALTEGLHEAGLQIHLETSGSSPLTGHIDWVTLSPKRFKEPLVEIFPHVDELKVVVLTRKDLIYAEKNAAECPAGTLKMLQPEWDTPESVPLIVKYVKENPDWRISLQTHKLLNVP
ncbi:7-carboxy-7-deazaguanine synthase QueE [Natronogracilivirga saccharolytica]|uniref:7-carboxy-7-deazaguanine synthase n=1 Tax=Natronogracilivirga saccharolytica TaxID=2812953 RepID=A0A8J7RKI2_9BACT|nr:7-carboxy-7-deazaguanine synthase QueE [Natronogracilivirga saccharolytica]MBP3192922.1 7-carboxy-7-deazaguanine synthase QueE [Natronogracilivirga saccharolytica]